MGEETTKLMGDYEILGVLGAGGMGRVYQVRNVITDRIEAMKVLLPDLEGQEEVAARFLREIKLLAALNHPNIARLHTALTINNQLVMIMEYVEGTTLASRLTSGPIPVSDALNYMDQALSALSYAHQQHVIHRDIKPANMMLTPEGVVKLMDFGIARTDTEPAKLTAPGTTLGSINYMSPEQVKGASIDERSDLYSVGISLYEMVTGEKPFHGDSNFSIMAAHIQQTPTPPVELKPGLPAGLNEIIMTSIAKSADERFQSAEAFRNAIKSVSNTLQDAKTVVVSPSAVTASGAVPAAYMRPVQTTTPRTATATAAAPVSASAKVPDYSITPPAKPGSGNRGLYMALGALIVVGVLVAAGIYLPGRKKGSVSAENSSAPPVTKQEAPVTPPPVQQQTAPPPVQEAPLADTPATAPKKMVLSNSGHDNQASAAAAAAAAAEKARQAELAKELDEVEKQIDQLYSRVAAVNSSLDRLQAQQAASGYGLRGDMAGHQASMKLNMSKAQSAIEHNDVERAKRYASATETDLEALEKFLGR